MPTRSHRIALRALAGLVAAAALAVPAQAGAATASISGSTLNVNSGHESSDLAVTISGGNFVVADTTGDVGASGGCVQSADSPRKATCPTAGITALGSVLGGGGDHLDTSAVALPVSVDGGAGHDRITTGSGADSISGDADDDWIDGGLGSDYLSGGVGSDFVGYWKRADDVIVQLGQGTTPGSGGARSGGENDVIATDFESAMGGAGNDLIVGNDAANVLWGGWSAGTAGPDGDDVLRGMGGADTLWGDQGTDIADYSDKSSAINASLDGSSNDPDGDTIYTDVEGLAGGSGNDVLTGNNGANVLRGGAGDDTLNALGDNDVVEGGAGADSLNGGAGIDRADYSGRTDDLTIDLDGVADDAEEGDNVKTDVEDVTGGSGDDALTGGSSANGLDGGPGNDTLQGGEGVDVYVGGPGTDAVSYADKASAAASLDGVANEPDGENVGSDVENLIGGPGADALTGNGVANALLGGGGDDTLNGAGGDDLLRGGAGSDTLEGGAGADTTDYSDKTVGISVSLDAQANDADGDIVGADVENLTGGSGDDTLEGGDGANVLTGGGGADTLTGGGGADRYEAGAGSDVIAARDGAVDTVVCGDGSDSGQADADDALAADCESAVERPAPPPVDEPAAGEPPADAPPSATGTRADRELPIEIKTRATVRLTANGTIPISVECTADRGTCRGRIELFEENGALKARTEVGTARRRPTKKPKRIRLARRSFAVRAGQKKNVTLRLDRNGRRRIINKRKKKKRRKTRGKIVITMKAPDGTKVTTEKSVLIKAPKQRRNARRSSGRRTR